MSKTRKAWEQVTRLNTTTRLVIGEVNSGSIMTDIKHFLFTLSRYKFACKMMKDCKNILDIGCGEGIAMLMFENNTKAKLMGVDFDKSQIEYANAHVKPISPDRFRFETKDMIYEKINGFHPDGISCIDVVEHIDESESESFYLNVANLLQPDGIAVFGTPNKFAHVYASERSKVGHINMYEPDRLVETLKRYFHTVVLFSMNDEMIHTGYNKMAHYLMAVCIR